MLIKSKNNKNSKGFTIIEVLVAISLVAFTLVAILSAFIYQNRQNNSTNDRNIAIMLAEERIEEYFKYPYDNMPDSATDYIVNNDLNNSIASRSTAVSSLGKIFERIVTKTVGTNTASINVRVNYGYDKANNVFNFNVELSTRKGN